MVGARHALRPVAKQRPLRAGPRDQVLHVQANAHDPGSVEWNLLHGGVGLGGAGPRLQAPPGCVPQGGGPSGRLGQSQRELLDCAVGTFDLAANLLSHQPPVGQPRGQALRQGLQRERQAVDVVLFPLEVDRFAQNDRLRPTLQGLRILAVRQPPRQRALGPVTRPYGVGRQAGERPDRGNAERAQVSNRPLRQREPVDRLFGQIGPVIAGNDGHGRIPRRTGCNLRRQASRGQSDMGRLACPSFDVAAHPRAQRRVGAIQRPQAGRVGKRQPHAGVFHQWGEAIQHVQDRLERLGVARRIVGDVDALRAALCRFLDGHTLPQPRELGGRGNLDQPPLVSLPRVDCQRLRRPRGLRLSFHRGSEVRNPEAERLAVHRTSCETDS